MCLDKDIDETTLMAGICTDKWCQATEHVIDELSNALFSISEARWSMPQDSEKLKKLGRRVYDLYPNYKDLFEKMKT